MLAALLTSFGGSFHFGYQLVVTNPSQAAFLSFLNQSYTAHYGTVLANEVIEILDVESAWIAQIGEL
uniref:Secreted protein n=1 Tax=Steinernema glaseri TaxID=37863 RepID=A0A1I7YR26_9BILA